MSVIERTLSEFLRASGEVIQETEHRDVILRRRDGEDLFLALRSRERGVRESFGILARLLRAALHDESAREALTKWATEELPWTTFLPQHELERFLVDFVQTAAASADADVYEPLALSLREWRSTAEVYANPELARALTEGHAGPSVQLSRPEPRV